MTSDLDIYRTAKLIFDQIIGDRDLAILNAAMRSDELLGSGDLEAAKVWRRVISAVGELARDAPMNSEGLH